MEGRGQLLLEGVVDGHRTRRPAEGRCTFGGSPWAPDAKRNVLFSFQQTFLYVHHVFSCDHPNHIVVLVHYITLTFVSCCGCCVVLCCVVLCCVVLCCVAYIVVGGELYCVVSCALCCIVLCVLYSTYRQQGDASPLS